jgi:hypothetical protein
MSPLPASPPAEAILVGSVFGAEYLAALPPAA